MKICPSSMLLLVASVSCLAAKVVDSSILWPKGRYGLLMPKSSCPSSIGFAWVSGYLYQDLENDKGRTMASQNAHFRGWISNDVERHFCIKNNTSTIFDANRTNWPAGQYCIYQKGSKCPVGMQSGSVLWDDENGINGTNKNNNSGLLPTGVYNQDTQIFFCCQINGSYDKPIQLPTQKPFYLMALKSQCQQVLNTVHTMEYILYDTENHNNHDKVSHPVPYGADWSTAPAIHYCYYRDVNPTTDKAPTANYGDSTTMMMSSSSSSSSSLSSPSSSSSLPAITKATVKSKTDFGIIRTSQGPLPTTRPLLTNQEEATFSPVAKTSTRATTLILETEIATKVTLRRNNTLTTTGEGINDVESDGDDTWLTRCVIVGAVVSFLVVTAVVATVFCFRRKSARTRRKSDQDRLHVAFTIPVKKVTGITNICVKEEEEVCQESASERYSVINKIEKINVLYGRGESFRGPSSPGLEETENPLYVGSKGSIIRSDNPLYISYGTNSPDQEVDNPLYTRSVEAAGDTDDSLYESLYERLKGAEDDDSDQPVYEKMV